MYPRRLPTRPFLRLAFAAAAAWMLGGCGPNAQAEKAVKALLNDPGSAQFTAMRKGVASGSVCGLVNAKNRMGGYTGPTPFFYEMPGELAAIAQAPEDSDFRMLWLGIKTGSFDNELSTVSQKCWAVGRWKDVCGYDYPGSTHALCKAMDGPGEAIYSALRAKYE